MDCDIVGIRSTLADAEIACIMVKTLEALGVDNFILRINSREVLTSFCEEVLGLSELETAQALRVVDKLDKIGLEEVSKELRCDLEECQKEEMWRVYEIEKDENPHAEPPLELSAPVADKLLKLVTIEGDSNDEVINRMAESVKECDKAKAAVEELRQCVAWLPDFGVDEDVVKVDPKVVRGLDYYTGIVYEAHLVGYENLGSVFGGGRYDKLIGKYLNRDVPAVGTSIGVDRLYDCLEIIGKTGERSSNTSVLIINFDEKMVPDYLRLSNRLRAAGIKNEVYPERKHFGDQVKYALSKSIPIALIYGEDEKSKRVVQIKDLATEEQIEVKEKDLGKKLRELLG
jgi:histidyl-tRNA synthetase